MVTLSSILRFAGIGGRFSLGHPMTWLLITLACLAIGYGWLSSYTTHASAVVSPDTVRKIVDTDLSDTLLEEDLPVEKEDEMLITRTDDEARAEEFLAYEALQQKILPLLDRADVHFENGQYVSPPGQNAWEDYNAILALSPGEGIAVSGKNKIKSTLVANAEQAIDEGEIEAAEGWLVQLDVIQPDDPAQAELRAEIKTLVAIETERRLKQQEEEALQRKIDTALEQAETESQKEESNINMARDLYDRVLELDPKNERASIGLTGLAEDALDNAEQALRDGDLEQSGRDLRLAADLDPANKRIGSLELALGANLKQQELAREQEELLARQAEEVEAAARKAEQAEAAAQDAKAEAQASAQAISQAISQAETQARAEESVAGSESAAGAEPSDADSRPTVSEAIPSNEEPLAQGIIAQARQNQQSAANATTASAEQRRRLLGEGIGAYYRGDYNRSFELLYPLAQEGVARAQFRIGIMYQFGRSVARNTDLAEKWFTEALPVLLRRAQEGVAWAQTDLGTAYEFGISLKQDFGRAAYWYQEAADQGYAGAQTNLGVLYAQGDGVPYNRSQAIFWFRKAARQGDRVARENLSILGASE